MEGPIYGGNFCFKTALAYTRSETCVSKGLGYSCSIFMSVTYSKVLLKLSLRTSIFLSLGHTSTLFIWTEKKSKSRLKSETYANRNIVTLFDCSHFRAQ